MSADADRYACPVCSEIHERVCARIAADRIAALEAELAEAQENERRINRERAALCTSLDQERAAHEHTKAELAQARAEVVNHLQRTAHVEFERDAAQAEAAAIQLAYHSFKAKWLAREVDAADIGELEVVIYGGGRALAARVPLWRKLQANMQLYWDADGRDPDALDEMINALHALAALDEKGGGA